MAKFGDWFSAFFGVGFAVAAFIVVPVLLLAGLLSALGLPPAYGLLVWGLVALAAAAVMATNVRNERRHRERVPEELLVVRTDAFLDDASGEDNVNGHPGRELASRLAESIAAEVEDSELDEVWAEDFGWCFWVRNRRTDGAFRISVGFAGDADITHEYVIETSPRGSCRPFSGSLTASDATFERDIRDAMKAFLRAESIDFEIERP